MSRGRAEEHDEVVVTSTIEYGDHDLIARLFGRRLGRVSAFARGARKSKRRFVGGLSPLARGAATFTSKPRGDLLVLARSELTADPGLAADVVAYGRSGYLTELCERLLPEREPFEEVFADLALCHRRLADGLADARLLRAFELRLLHFTGYLPDLDELEEPCVAYDPARGHLTFESGPGTLPFDDGARKAALELLERGLTSEPSIDTDTLRTVSRIFASHLRRMNVGDLKSIAFLRSVS